MWLERGRLSGTEYTPENGWDDNKVEFFRRHIVQLGRSGLFVIYDELEGKEAVEWDYLLHTVCRPMEVSEENGGLRVLGKNDSGGVSVAHLLCSQEMTYTQTDTFFVAAIDWKKRLGKTLSNHYHFRAATSPCERACFLNVVDVHGGGQGDVEVRRDGNRVTAGDWIIECNLEPGREPFLYVENMRSGASLKFDYGRRRGATVITDHINGKTVSKRLTDSLPELEI